MSVNGQEKRIVPRGRKNRKRHRIRRVAMRLVGYTICLMALYCCGMTVGAKLAEYTIVTERFSPEANIETSPIIADKPSEINNADAWNLILVNKWNPLPNNYEFTIKKLKNGQAVDERCYEDLQKMMDDCRAAGNSPLICSSYRSKEKQESLFNKKKAQFESQGYSKEKAKAKAATVVAVPQTSEHQSGLAVDIVDESYQILDTSQEKTQVQKWLMKNSWKYGFILRYPSDKSEITGIIYEPWHYRYVGKEAAKEITEQNICLEEYLSK